MTEVTKDSFVAVYVEPKPEICMDDLDKMEVDSSSLPPPKGESSDYYTDSCIKKLSPQERKRRLNQRRQCAARHRTQMQRELLKK